MASVKAFPKAKAGGKIVMVVDDEPDIRETMKALLRRNGYSVVLAKSAEDCLEKLKAHKPSLVLMDIMMPGKSVREAIAKMPKQKIIFVSVVRVSEAEKEDLLNHPNVVGFIQKPFELRDLVEMVKKHA